MSTIEIRFHEKNNVLIQCAHMRLEKEIISINYPKKDIP